MSDLDVIFKARGAIAEQLKNLVSMKLASKFRTYDLSTELAWKLRQAYSSKIESYTRDVLDQKMTELSNSIWRIDPIRGSTNRSINDFILVNGAVVATLAASVFIVSKAKDENSHSYALTLIGKEEGSILGFISAESESIALDALSKLLLEHASDQYKV